VWHLFFFFFALCFTLLFDQTLPLFTHGKFPYCVVFFEDLIFYLFRANLPLFFFFFQTAFLDLIAFWGTQRTPSCVFLSSVFAFVWGSQLFLTGTRLSPDRAFCGFFFEFDFFFSLTAFFPIFI